MDGQEEKLHQEILKDARRKAERIVSRAEREARQALDAMRRELEEERADELAAAESRAKGKYVAITARIEHEIQCQWLNMREERLESLFATIPQALVQGEGVDTEASLRQLTREALHALGGGEITVRVAPAAKACLTEAGLKELARSTSRCAEEEAACKIVPDDTVRGGVILENVDGNMRFDNTYATRLERLKPALRALLAAEPAFETD